MRRDVSFPESLISKRWVKDAKSLYVSAAYKEESDSDRMFLARFGYLVAYCNMLCKIAAKKPEHFKLVKYEIWKLSQMLDKQGDQHTPRGASVDDVGDPDVIKSKGAPKKKSSNRKFRKCSICNTVGHNRTTCPKRACAEDQPACNDHPSSSFGDSSEYNHDVEGMSSDESLWKDNEPTSRTEPQVNDTMKRKRSVNGGSISTDMKSDSVTHFSNMKMKSTGPIGVAKKDPTVGVSLVTPKKNLYPYGIAPPYGIRPPYGIAPPYGIRPPYGIAPSWQGMPLYPYGLAPLHPQFPRVPLSNQHVSGASNVGDGTSMCDLLNSVMNNGNGTSGNPRHSHTDNST
ncbi:hypothetical protein RIF29_29857 [Crotalaria pallida]|uniref:Uncharacterized protein n=1 Tax=Crotalaria pallida TaxID=3830 RepID=A0AAN9EHM3_CROPI